MVKEGRRRNPFNPNKNLFPPSWNRALYYYQGNSTGVLKGKGNTEWAINEFLQILLHSWSGSPQFLMGEQLLHELFIFLIAQLGRRGEIEVTTNKSSPH